MEKELKIFKEKGMDDPLKSKKPFNGQPIDIDKFRRFFSKLIHEQLKVPLNICWGLALNASTGTRLIDHGE